jgi:hypothetical protein
MRFWNSGKQAAQPVLTENAAAVAWGHGGLVHLTLSHGDPLIMTAVRSSINPYAPDLLLPSDNGQPTQAESVAKPPVPDLFADLAGLRLSQDFAASIGVKKALLTVPVRKPAKEWFVRSHPTLRIETCVLELKEARETYLVAPALWSGLASESTFGPRALFAAMNRQNVLFVWPVRLPGTDGKLDNWNRSALEAASMAESRWVRVASNMELGAYEVSEATADWPEPDWPDLPFNEILRIAFKGHVIESFDHPKLKQLRGEA